MSIQKLSYCQLTEESWDNIFLARINGPLDNIQDVNIIKLHESNTVFNVSKECKNLVNISKGKFVDENRYR